MDRKKWFFALAALALPALLRADFMLVYENKEALEKGQFHTGTIVKDGTLVPADLALKGKDLLMGAIGGDLYKASLLRLDNDLGLAVLKGGDRVFDPKFLEAHKINGERLERFVPQEAVAVSTDASKGEAAALASSESFLLRIDGKVVGVEPITLPVKSKKSKFDLDIIRPKADPIWRVNLELHAEPRLSFWNANKKSGMNDVPVKVFKYTQQAMFQPLAEGRFVSIPVEVHFIKQEEYTLKFKVWSKSEKLEQDVKVKFIREEK